MNGLQLWAPSTRFVLSVTLNLASSVGCLVVVGSVPMNCSLAGVDFMEKTIELDEAGETVRLMIWDTAGQERFRSLIPSYLKDAHCALIIFDVTSRNSLIET